MARTQIISTMGAFLISAAVLTALTGRTASADANDQVLAATMAGDAAQVETLLEEQGADVDTRTERGFTVLVAATAYGYTDVARVLIEAGATVDARGPIGNTPLLIAAQEGHTEIAALLIANGANTMARNDHGGTPMAFATGWGHRDIITQLRNAEPVEDDDSPAQPVVAFAVGLMAVVGIPVLVVGAMHDTEHAHLELAAVSELAHKL